MFEIEGQEWRVDQSSYHIRTCIGNDYKNVYIEHKKQSSSSSVASGFFVRVSEQEKEMHLWISFVVMRNLPVSFADCPNTCDVVRMKPVSARTLRHILSLCDVLKETLRKELPSKFVVVFDGWTEGTQH
jgi:hypothetical protein